MFIIYELLFLFYYLFCCCNMANTWALKGKSDNVAAPVEMQNLQTELTPHTLCGFGTFPAEVNLTVENVIRAKPDIKMAQSYDISHKVWIRALGME